MFCPLKILHSNCWCKKHHTEFYVQYSFSCLSNWEIWTNLKKQMNACITNFSEVLGHRLSPFSHCYTKRAHFILSCLGDVRFMFDLSKQNTYMTTGSYNIQVFYLSDPQSPTKILFLLRCKLGRRRFVKSFQADFWPGTKRFENQFKVGLWKLLKDPISV